MSATADDRARFFLERGDHRRALEEAGRGLAEDPSDEGLLLIEIQARHGLGDREGAIASAERLVAGAPDAWWAHAAHADALAVSDRHIAARRAAERAVAAGPDQAGAWISLATAELGAEHAREAQDAAETALALDPGSADAALVRAWALAARGHGRQARAAFHEILAGDAENPQAHAGLAAADLASLRFRDAQEAALRSLAIAPDDAGLRELHLHTVRARTPLGRLLYALGALHSRLPNAGWALMVAAWLGVQVSVRGPVKDRIGDGAAAAIGVSWVGFCVVTWIGSWLIDRRLRGDPATAHLYEDRD